nr:hypothetical protein [Tanacetum cinerariifolium]
METQAIDDQDPLVNYDNNNKNDDLGYQSKEYFDEVHEDDENNHSNENVVKRGITRKTQSIVFEFLGDMRCFDVDLTVRKLVKSAAAKMACSKSVYQHTMGGGGYVHMKEKMVDHGTNAMKVVLSKEKGGYARGVGSEVKYKRYFDLPRSRQASAERILLLQSQLDNERREHEEKELLIQNLSNKMSQTEGMATKLNNQLAA